LKRCTVACDTPAGIVACDLQLPDSATIDDALQAARSLLGDANVSWDNAATGVFGKVRGRGHVWEDGQRIEVYRPLQLDPRARRRQRAARR
jgi:uncharacterized protein